MTNFIIFCAFFAIGNSLSFMDTILEEWELFKTEFSKTYEDNRENMYRMKIYMENKYKIARHNKKYNKGEITYSLSINQFGDMLPDEIMSKLNLNLTSLDNEAITYIPPYNVTPPNSIDWRGSAVTPVKDQGQCGSCWAFSATGSLEGQNFRKTGKLIPLSEQNLVDCSFNFGNKGCDGGIMHKAFEYIKAKGCIDTEEAYPYEGKGGQCRYNPNQCGASCKGYVILFPGAENLLKTAVATVGPISVAIDASRSSFHFYHQGWYYEPLCSSIRLNHAVLTVGYGTIKDGQDYWLVKNSWGRSWGDTGYIKMARNQRNNCGIASHAIYPLV